MVAANFYSGAPFDRDDALRRDERALERLRADPSSRVLALWQQHCQVRSAADPAPMWRGGEDARALLDGAEVWALLGRARDGAAHFAVDVSHIDDPGGDERLRGGEFVDLRAVGPLAGRADGATMAYARGLILYLLAAAAAVLRRVRRPLRQRPGRPRAALRRPGMRGGPFSAHRHPAVIVLVTHGGLCLLGHQKSWRAGMHSTLAGFVEPGESLEEAVVREVREEAGATLRDPIYQSSQPWPFPSSLMLGFRAEAESLALEVDTREIERAAWYSRAQLRDSPEDDGFRLPRRDSIARRLIDDWVAEGG